MHLYRRRNIYHFRVRIPSDLQHLIPTTELIKSLKTTDHKLAQIAVTPYSQKTHEVFTLLRVGILTPEQAQERLNVILQRNSTKSKPDEHEAMLTTAISQFINDRQHGWGVKTKLENAGTFKLIQDILGDMPIKKINRLTVRRLQETMLKLPANMYKVYPDKTVKVVLDLENVTPMSISSVNKHLSRFSSFLKFCRDEYGLEENPALGLSIRQNRRADEERKAYSLDDIQNILRSLPAPDNDHPERHWIPLISLYSGMRLDEIAQLYVGDVREIDGIWCFDVNKDGDKKVKTLSGIRAIPIHPILQEMGLLEFVARVREDQSPRLWMNLSRREADGYGNAIGKWYQRFNRQHITDDPQKTFHSFRHSFANALKQNGVQEALIAELLGHTNSSITTGRYGKRYQPRVLLEAICSLTYS